MSVTDPKFNPSGKHTIQLIKSEGVIMEEIIISNTPEGRLRSIALIHLETALMFAVKAAATADE